ncbi:MAG: adenylate/guanylate cyclase domain-containing protein [Bacteroides sp.]|nr:adenylate/guanylate cyclase domain-containing protein [Bacteroides sp.]
MIFFILITCASGINRGIAQDRSLYPLPWVQEINLPEHFNDIPNKSFHLDGNKNLFLGKGNGISIINGKNAYHLSLDGPVYFAGTGPDTVYYASENDMGYLLKDKSGKYTIRSQKDRISRINRNFLPRRMFCLGESVFINTDRGVYQNTKGRIKYHPFPENTGKLHKLDGQLLLRKNHAEIYIWNGDDFQAMTEEEIKQNEILLIPEKIELNPDLSFLEYLSNNEVLALSEEMGIVIMDKTGNITSAPGIVPGFPDRDIKQAFLSEDNELWILGDYSLYKTRHPSLLNTLPLAPPLFGRIYASENSGRRIILGTSRGLFIAEPEEKGPGLWKIRNLTRNQAESFHLMTKAGSRIFAAGSQRLISVYKEEMEEISEGNFSGLNAIHQDLVVASEESGLLRFERKQQGWTKTIIDPQQSSSFSFVKFDERIFLICKNGVYRLTENLGESKSIPFHREELLQKLVALEDQLYLVTDSRVYRYIKSEETFLPAEKDSQSRILSASDIIIPDHTRGYWTVQHQGKYTSRVIHQLASGTSNVESRLFPVLQSMGRIIDLKLMDSVLYLTGTDKILIFNLSLLGPNKNGPTPKIEALNGTAENRHEASSAIFQISALEFQSTPFPKYRYRVVPDLEEWSEWNKSSLLTFNRLKPGDYTLYVQSMDLYGRISNPAEIQFSIKAPFYKSWYAYTFYGFILLIGLLFIRKLRHLSYRLAESRVSQRMQTKLDDLTHEKEKSDKIAADILPNRTVQQIRLEGKAKWDKYERATVLFSDIQGFTKIAEEMNPEALIDELDQFFFHFDSVVEKYNIEKIKTIGDAYMAAGGIPEKNSTNPVEVVLAALEMQAYMQELKSSKAKIWDLRIGVHTGPVIAGVVGHKKVSYDIWGDTVNTASRMESSGIPGKVNISAITYGMVKDYFICEYRGKLPVKYKGNIDMYFVTGLRPELAVDLKGIPNKRFFIKLQILRLGDLEDRVFETILSNMPDSLHFHNLKYARKVYSQSFLLCRAEEMEQQDRLLIRTAALMLYTGLTQAYANYQNRSSVIAREILPEFQYSESQIDKICNLIMATKLPFQPNNLPEKILIDSKMEYIGRPDYPVRIKLLFQEMVENGINLNGQQFKKQQLELLYTFDYFTLAARRLREVPGDTQQTSLEQERWI